MTTPKKDPQAVLREVTDAAAKRRAARTVDGATGKPLDATEQAEVDALLAGGAPSPAEESKARLDAALARAKSLGLDPSQPDPEPDPEPDPGTGLLIEDPPPGPTYGTLEDGAAALDSEEDRLPWHDAPATGGLVLPLSETVEIALVAPPVELDAVYDPPEDHPEEADPVTVTEADRRFVDERIAELADERPHRDDDPGPAEGDRVQANGEPYESGLIVAGPPPRRNKTRYVVLRGINLSDEDGENPYSAWLEVVRTEDYNRDSAGKIVFEGLVEQAMREGAPAGALDALNASSWLVVPESSYAEFGGDARVDLVVRFGPK